MQRALSLNQDSFRKYGTIIEYPSKASKGTVRNLWRIVHAETGRTGWRAAYLVLRDRTIGRLECHPHSDEAFVPVKGQALFFVAKDNDVAAIECFKLERPFVLKKGTWHGLVTVTPETEIMIFENVRVACRYWDLGRRISTIKDLCRSTD